MIRSFEVSCRSHFNLVRVRDRGPRHEMVHAMRLPREGSMGCRADRRPLANGSFSKTCRRIVSTGATATPSVRPAYPGSSLRTRELLVPATCWAFLAMPFHEAGTVPDPTTSPRWRPMASIRAVTFVPCSSAKRCQPSRASIVIHP